MKKATTKGPWGIRILIRLFTVALGILIFWLLGFVVEDIESIQGPDYQQVERQFVDASLIEKDEQLGKQLAELNRKLAEKQDEQRLVSDSSQNLQRTINQLLDLQKLSIQKDVSLPDSEKTDLSTSLAHFLESQKNYQSLNQSLADLTSKKLLLEDDKQRLEQQISQEKEPAAREYGKQIERHRLRLAVYQLLILVPLLLIAGFFLNRRRTSIYYPLFLAFGGATLCKVGLVIHEYFPSQYVKYVLILGLLAVVARLLVHLIKIVAFPKKDWLWQQYREAYERFLCPICEYPIRTGPRKFLYWTRRTVHKVLPQPGAFDKDEPYSCPSCGTLLFDECESCHKIRHCLLEHCQYCGATRASVGQ